MSYDEAPPGARQIHPPARTARNRRSSGGQSLVEMALVAPIVIVLLFGVVEMGRLFFAWVTVQHSARTGARFAVTGLGQQEGTRLKQIVETVRDAASGLPPGDVKVVVRSWRGPRRKFKVNDPGGPCDLIEVEAQYAYRPVMPVVASLMPDQIILRGADRKRNEPWARCEDAGSGVGAVRKESSAAKMK